MLLGISGSLRAGSVNRKIIREAARYYEDDFIEADIRFPLYDGDLEDSEGVPEAVQTLADQIRAADAVAISTPEYNKSLSGVLKNALDWVSRLKGNPWKDKPVAIMSGADGRAGGARGNFALRLALTQFRPRLLTYEFLVADARNAFDEDGRFLSESYDKQMATLMTHLRAEVARGDL